MRFPFFKFLLITLTLSGTVIKAEKKDSIAQSVFGIEHRNSEFFRDKYLHNNLTHYLDNYDDYVTYQSETTGDFNLPDMTIFSISGNSHKWNKYYLDGFRIDNRIFAGSNFYNPDLTNHSLSIDYYSSIVVYKTDFQIPNSITLGYNVGGLGGISPFTESLVNLFHKTASQRQFQPIGKRKQMKGAGTLHLNYELPIAGKKYTQQIYADFGTRMMLDFDESGINNYYPEDFFKIQLSGALPITVGKLFDQTNYLAGFSQRQNLYSEQYFSKDETAKNNAFNFSFYGTKQNADTKYTSGLTLATNNIRHNVTNFSRNIVDQDGEAFEPWYPSANTIELSHALNFEKKIKSNLFLNFDSYNSIINFNPTQQNSQNQVFTKGVLTEYKSLYICEWESNPFTSGLLENTLSLQTNKKLASNLDFKASADLTLDGMLMSSKSMIRPNWQAQIGLNFQAFKWFRTELNIARKRVSFNFDHIKYFSDDYQNGDLYYWKDNNNDRQFQDSEKSDFFTSTGGKYHTAVSGLKQNSYIVLDLPLYFQFGKHDISLLNTFKKYNNNWTTRYENSANNYGDSKNDQNIFMLYGGEKINYIVDYYPEELMKSEQSTNFMTNSPFYYSSVFKYQYNGKKLLFSIAWTSYIMTGISTLGNGPLHNNLDVYSETSANPNINSKLVGRLDQERAFLTRILLAYKVTKNFSFTLTGKFKDGQPFTNFNTYVETDANGNNQAALWSNRTKGINPFNGDFGSREDAFFNIDLSTSLKGKISNYGYEIQLMMYNLYDFGTELGEYTFEPEVTGSRYALELNIPRGLMISAKLNF